jgi:uncharacterized protein
MSPPWSRPLDVARLADGGAEVDFAVALAELTGLRSLRAAAAGSVHGRVRFTRERGIAVAELALGGSATLECQRCMRPMHIPLESLSRLALVSSEAEAAGVPAELEPVRAEGGRISIGGLVTEELLLTLPIVPLHADAADCAGVAAAGAAGAERPDTQRPFAQLAELMKR